VTADRSTSNELDLITDPAALSFQPAADCCALRDAPPLESPDGTPLWPPADDFRKTRPGRRGPGKQFPQQASSPRPSYAEVEQRIAEAQLWIAQRLPMAVIREKAKSSWGVESTFTLQKYLRTARQRMVNELITDRLAQEYGGNGQVQLRYIATQTVTVYSGKIDQVRASQKNLVELGKKGIAFSGGDFQQTQYLFTKLNDVKPAMIEEATRKAREVAETFAADSNSKLGKIKGANQGQFSVEDRDSNTPYIKRVRVVSTVDYYLSD